LCAEAAHALGIEDIERRVAERMSRPPEGIPRFETRLDMFLAHALNDEAGRFVLEGLTGSTVAAYARVAKHIIDDEKEHGSQGRRMLFEEFSSSTASPADKERLLILHLDAAIRCLGRPDTQHDDEAVACGLKTKPARSIITEYCEYADSIVVALGYAALTPLARRYLALRDESPSSQRDRLRA